MSAAGGKFHITGGSLDPATVTSLPPAVQHEVFAGIAHGVQGVFVWVTPAALLVFVLALFIKEVPLRERCPRGREARPRGRSSSPDQASGSNRAARGPLGGPRGRGAVRQRSG